MRNISFVPVVLFGTITTALENLGESSERVVEKAGLPMWQNEKPHILVPSIHYYRILEFGARTLGCGSFGCLIPDHTPIECIGRLGREIGRTLTIYDAITTASRFYSRIASAATFWTAERDEELWWFRSRNQEADTACRQIELSTVSYMIDVIRLGAGPSWVPKKIFLESGAIPGLDRLELFGDADIRDFQGISGVAVPRSLLPRPIDSSHISTDRIKDDKPIFPPPPSEFVSSLRRVVQSYVLFGHPAIDEAADIAGMGVRALQRYLASNGTTFKRIVDEARFLASRELLRDQNIKLVEVAHALGYSDQAHFNRAFRRWAGIPPGEYRAQHVMQ